MSQWGGHIRSFLTTEDGENYIRVVPHVAGPTWEPLDYNHLIDDLVLCHVTGSDYFAHAKMIELKQEWVGKTYREWCNSPAAIIPKPKGFGFWDTTTGRRVWNRIDKPDKDEVDS